MAIIDVLYILSLIVVAVLTVVGLWCKSFQDNLLQTFGMAAVCAGCVIRLGCMAIHQPVEATRYMVMYGLALYGLGTAWKVYKFRNTQK